MKLYRLSSSCLSAGNVWPASLCLFLIPVFFSLVLAVAAPGAPVQDQSGSPSQLLEARITKIDPAKGLITAYEPINGLTFEFVVKEAAQLRALKLDQRVYVDTAAKKAFLHKNQSGKPRVGWDLKSSKKL